MGDNDGGDDICCVERTERRDCDGDVSAYCLSCESCRYKRDVKDCDGDIVSFCDK